MTNAIPHQTTTLVRGKLFKNSVCIGVCLLLISERKAEPMQCREPEGRNVVLRRIHQHEALQDNVPLSLIPAWMILCDPSRDAHRCSSQLYLSVVQYSVSQTTPW